MSAGIDPWIMVALVASEAEAGRVKVFTRRWPRLLPAEGWPGGDLFFVDASAVTARRQGGEASLVKLAVLHRRAGGWERLLAPRIADGAPPVLYLGGGERLRQAMVYVVELASLLALSRAERLGGARLEGPRILVRHGPLLQQLSHYFSPVYDVDWDTGYAALRYAGLPAPEAASLLNESRAGGARINLGLLALRLLGGMAREAGARNTRRSGEGLLFAGIVEDTSRSRVLVASLLAEIMVSRALGAGGGGSRIDTDCLAERLLSRALDWSSSYGGVHGVDLSGCLCGDNPLASVAADDVARELVAPILEELRIRFRASLVGAEPLCPPLSLVEAAAASSGAVPDITDSELLYNLVYLGLDPGAGFTAPRSRSAVAEWAAVSLESKRERLRPAEEPGELAWPARRVLYTYMLPDSPPSCRSLAAKARALGLQACSLSRLVTVAPAVRVEWLTPVDPGLLEGLLSAVYWASKLVLYKYPPQLLVVDAASRVTWSEYAGLERLAEEIARRRRPYSSFLRGWASRGAMLSTGI